MTRRRKSAVYTPQQRTAFCEAILEWVAEGKPLRAFCRESGNPPWRTVYFWRTEDPDFAARFARARVAGAEAIAEDILEIADDGRNDWMERLDRDGQGVGWELNGDHVKRSALRIDARLKLLARWFPQQYGDRADRREPLKIDLPPIRSAADLPAAFDVVAVAVREGRLNIEELDAVQKVLAGYRSAFGEAEFARELAELRAKIEATKEAV